MASGMDAVHAAVPVAVPAPPVAALVQVTLASGPSSEAVPASTVGDPFVAKSTPPLVVISRPGSVVSLVTVIVSDAEGLPAVSIERTSITFAPDASGTDAVHVVVPVAATNAAGAILHSTSDTPTLSAAVPPIVSGVPPVR